MKIKAAIVILSVVGVGLLAAIISVNRGGPASPAESHASHNTFESESAPAQQVAATEIKPTGKRVAAGPGFHWSQVESSDFREYIAKLKATGCPQKTINDIIIAEINSVYAPKEGSLKAQIESFRARPSGDATDVASTKQEFAARKQLRAIEQQKQAAIKELLGVEIPLEPIRGWHQRTYDRYESALNTVPGDKREKVREIQESYWEVSDYLNDKYELRRTPEYLEEYKKINAERKARLAEALSPQEAQDYEMRVSGIASRLGTYLSGTGVTPDEFRQIYNAKNSVEAPYGGTVRVNETETGETPDHLQDKEAAERKVAEILGPQRYAAYQLAQDPNFQRFSDLGDRFGVSRDNLVQAYRLQLEMTPPRQPGPPIRPGLRPSLEDMQRYQSSMKELLGEPAFNALQRGQNFSAINQLFP